ncbi:MAG: flagellar hook-length control protein FliK [Deltaproteobacteria bacterium]|nr:flagellar hook-length control protein FliK [Deltaproteobacteria bacterium]
MNPLVTSFVSKLGETLLQEGIKGGLTAAAQKGSRSKKGSPAAEDLSSFANILSGTMAKTGGNKALKNEKNAALLQMKMQVQEKAKGAEGAGKVKNRSGFEGQMPAEIAAEAKTASQKKVVTGKVAKSSDPAGALREGLTETQKLKGGEASVLQASAEALKGGKKLQTLASVSETLKEGVADAKNIRSRKSQLQVAAKGDQAEQKFDASEALLNRTQGIKSPKSSLAGVSEFTQQKGKTEKGSLNADKTQAKETGVSRGQKKTEAGRPEVPRSDATNIKDKAEGAKAPVAEGKASATEGANRQEDRFANIFQARTESATGRVMENAGPLRPQVIIPQVVDGASNLLRSGSGRVVITLHPPQLGTIDMDIQVRDNKVSMLMRADNHEVKQVLESSLTQLRNALSEQGLQVDRIDVLVQDRSGNEFAGLLHERGSSSEGRGQAESGGQNARGAEADSGEVRRSMDADESKLVNIFA